MLQRSLLHDRVLSAQRVKPRQSAHPGDLLERQGVDLPPRARVGQLLQWGEREIAVRVWRTCATPIATVVLEVVVVVEVDELRE